MCGIWASLGIRPGRAVIDAIAHRGPDGEGWHEVDSRFGRVTLAHRRLAVIDTSAAGAQPMPYADGRYWLVFNGMIYNHEELREELIRLGHRFRGHADSEVLLAAYAEWGEDCLDRFNGMFAFVIWDAEACRLFAARDRFGVKPLYYWMDGENGVAFASEIKQFLPLAGFSPRVNRVCANDFLTFGLSNHGHETLFRGVFQLRGGEYAVIELDRWQHDPHVQPRRWYSYPEVGILDLSVEEAARRLRTLLEDSVRLRLRSDVAIGFCLSGGLDSSSIVGIADKLINSSEMKTVSACYDDPSVDERRYIDLVNESTFTKSIKVFPDGGKLVEELNAIIWHHDGPFTSTSMFAQWCVFRAAHEARLVVMLDGQGADEHLCGYHGAFAPFHAGLFRNGRWVQLMHEMSAQRRRHGASMLDQVAMLGASVLPGSLRGLVRRIRRTHRPKWLNDDFTADLSSPLPQINDLNTLIRTQTFEAGLPMLLHYEDRSSMAHGIESRLPFLDHRVVELSVGLGERHKIVDGETKYLLRRAMNSILPAAIRDRQDKIGFSTPERSWLLGPARALVEHGIEEAIERFPEIFSAPALRKLCNGAFAADANFDFTVWRVICFAAWGRVFGAQV